MTDDQDTISTTEGSVFPNAHRRILIILAILGVVGAIAGTVFVSIRFGIGVSVGVGLAFANYYWLKHSLKKVFDEAAEGEKPKVSAIRYIGRYLALGAVIAFIYITEIVPIVPVILGTAGFGFAVVVDGTLNIFTSFSNRKEI